MWPLDASLVAEWLDKYNHARRSYVGGYMSRIEAVDALRNLRYRDDALKIEILEWERAKMARTSRQIGKARHKLRGFIDEPEGITTPSSL